MSPVAGWEWEGQKERWTTLQILNELRAGRAYRGREALARHRPVEVLLQITSGCNLDCIMCGEHNRPPALRHGVGLMSLAPEIFDKVETQLFPHSHTVTLGVGGEPMLAPRFAEYVRRAYAANQAVRVMTNGTRLVTDELVGEVVRSVTKLQVSIDGASRDTYERIRQGAHWGQLMANLERLRRVRRATEGAALRHLAFCFVLMRTNFRELPDYVRLAARSGADEVRAQSLIPVTEEGLGEVLGVDRELFDVLAEARAVGEREGVALDLPEPVDPAARALEPTAPRAPGIACHMPTLALFVNYAGVISPCAHPAATASWKMGDLREQDFDEIWNSTLYRNLRAGLAHGPASPVCQRCSLVHRDQMEGDGQAAPDTDLASFYAGQDLVPLDAIGRFAPMSGTTRAAAELADELTRDPARRSQLAGWLDRLDRPLPRNRPAL